MGLLKHVARLFRRTSPQEKELQKAFTRIIGKRPFNLKLYVLAMKHSSVGREMEGVEGGFKESNERLEYLGDAVLGAVVAEYLFQKFPFRDEGFLTEIRSRIVNRESLNMLAIKIGLSQLVDFEGKKRGNQSHKSIYGDAMEAFIGALYLDMGFHFCRRYIVRNLLMRHYDLSEIVDTTNNFKSLIIEWAQKNMREVVFEPSKQDGKKHMRQFSVTLKVDGEEIAVGKGLNKKKAEQDAARRACEVLQIG